MLSNAALESVQLLLMCDQLLLPLLVQVLV